MPDDSPAINWKRLKELADCACEGMLSQADVAELSEMLISREPARAWYINYLRIHAWLDYDANLAAAAWQMKVKPDGATLSAGEEPLATQLGIVTGQRKPMAPASRRWSLWSAPGLAASLAVGLLFYGAFVLISWNLRSAPSLDTGVARISDDQDVEWLQAPQAGLAAAKASDALSIAHGERLSITSGLVELSVKRGATVLIEGPAEWSVDSENSVTLHRGKLLARVPRRATGFTLLTPTAKVVDLGTEFLAEVQPTGQTTVQVIQGEVQCGQASTNDDVQRIAAGQAWQIGREAESSSIVSRSVRFAPAPPAIKKPGQQRLERWRAQSQQLQTDRSLMAYYDFEASGAPRANVLPNLLADRLHGQISTPRDKIPWSTGRFLAKRALTLGEDFARVTIPHDAALLPESDFSLAVWFRVDALPVGVMPNDYALIVGKGRYPHRSYSLWLRTDGVLHWSLNDQQDKLHFLHCHERLAPNRWYLAVGVHHADKVLLYVNGALANAIRLPAPLKSAVDDTPLAIGRSLEPDRDLPFTGAIDELALFGRALSAQEVKTLYQNGRSD